MNYLSVTFTALYSMHYFVSFTFTGRNLTSTAHDISTEWKVNVFFYMQHYALSELSESKITHQPLDLKLATPLWPSLEKVLVCL